MSGFNFSKLRIKHLFFPLIKPDASKANCIIGKKKWSIAILFSPVLFSCYRKLAGKSTLGERLDGSPSSRSGEFKEMSIDYTSPQGVLTEKTEFETTLLSAWISENSSRSSSRIAACEAQCGNILVRMLEIVLAEKFIFNYKIKIRQFRGWWDSIVRDYRNVPDAFSFPLWHYNPPVGTRDNKRSACNRNIQMYTQAYPTWGWCSLLSF